MANQVTKVDVLSAEIADQPGALADKLRPLADAGADLSFVIARRQPDKPGTGVVYLAGLKGAKQQKAATSAGFAKALGMFALRVEAPNKPGSAHKYVSRLAESGINLRGLSASVIGSKFVTFLAFDNADDAAKAGKLIKSGK